MLERLIAAARHVREHVRNLLCYVWVLTRHEVQNFGDSVQAGALYFVSKLNPGPLFFKAFLLFPKINVIKVSPADFHGLNFNHLPSALP